MARISKIRPKLPAEKLGEILRCAAEVFAEKGYEGASIRDISRESGISLAGLYYHVASKQRILYLIQRETFGTIVARLERRLSVAAGPEDRLRALVYNHLEYFLKHPLEMKVLSHEDQLLDAEYRKEVATLKRKYYEIALDIFRELRRSGARSTDVRVAVLSLFGMMSWVPMWYRKEVDPPADQMAEVLAGIFLDGVMDRTKDGRRGRTARLAHVWRRDQSEREVQ
jgi:TetR/AcrR family transcriptional regulator, cholesterol catabolism regulator